MSSTLTNVESLIRDGVKNGQHFGVQLSVHFGDGTIVDIVDGQAQPGLPLTPDTLVLWKSSGKPVTAVAVMRLLEQGRVDLDDPVTRFIPDFGQHGKDAITVRHLLTHTGGFRPERFLLPDDDWDAVIGRICETPLEDGWVPGKSAGYHALTSWFIIAEVVQRVAGQPFSQYVRTHIFEPLDMADCWVGLPEEVYQRYADAKRIAALPDTSRDPIDLGQHHAKEALTATNPGGGMIGPANQMVRLYEMFLGGGEREGVRILQPDTVVDMTARHRVGAMDRTFKYPMQWGLGLILEPDRREGRMPYGYGRHASPRAFGHGGIQSSVAFADPAHGLAVALAFIGMPGEPAHQGRVDAVLTALYEDLGLVG